jgi:transcriptional regulator with XRE-family HTH domain
MRNQESKRVPKPYKYKILHLMRKLPREKERIIYATLPGKLGVNQTTFRDWLYIKEDDKREISSIHLHHIAQVLNVEFLDLFTTRPEFATYDELQKRYEREQQQKFGLKQAV